MYQRIHNYRITGFSKSEISRLTGLDRATVRKYYRMSAEDYRLYRLKQQSRFKEFERFKADILEIYRANGNRKLNKTSVAESLNIQRRQKKVTHEIVRALS